jgi:hypothetical protein
MYIKGFIIVLCLALCASCAPRDEENVPAPDYILKEDVFIDVLTDCYLGEGAAGINVKNVTGVRFDSAYLFNPFEDRRISKQQFDTTIVWYSQHPKKLKEVYNKLLENLSRILAVGSLGSMAPVADKYTGQDLRFYFTETKIDSIENSTKKAGYSSKIPYRVR